MRPFPSEKRVELRRTQPFEQVGHNFGNVGCGGSGMDQSIPVVYSCVFRPEGSRVLAQAFHHDAVGLEEVVHVARIPVAEQVVCSFGIPDLPDIVGRTEDAPAVDDIGHLLHCERVLLDSQRRVYGFDTQLAMEDGRGGQRGVGCEPSHHLGDIQGGCSNLVGGVEGRFVHQRPPLEYFYRQYFTANGGKKKVRASCSSFFRCGEGFCMRKSGIGDPCADGVRVSRWAGGGRGRLCARPPRALGRRR